MKEEANRKAQRPTYFLALDLAVMRDGGLGAGTNADASKTER